MNNQFPGHSIKWILGNQCIDGEVFCAKDPNSDCSPREIENLDLKLWTKEDGTKKDFCDVIATFNDDGLADSYVGKPHDVINGDIIVFNNRYDGYFEWSYPDE